MHLTHAFDAFDVCIWRMHLTHAFDACICGGRLRISVTRCGNYWKILATNISNKRSPNDWQLFGLLEKLLWKNCFGYFLGNFLKYLGYFLLQDLVKLVAMEKIGDLSHLLHCTHPPQSHASNAACVNDSSRQIKVVFKFESFLASLFSSFKYRLFNTIDTKQICLFQTCQRSLYVAIALKDSLVFIPQTSWTISIQSLALV